jgi:hypothetical protein
MQSRVAFTDVRALGGILRPPGEFETCPDWVPGRDTARLSAPMMMKAKSVHGFDHTANWMAKVRNVSRLGSQLSFAVCQSCPSFYSNQPLKGRWSCPVACEFTGPDGIPGAAFVDPFGWFCSNPLDSGIAEGRESAIAISLWGYRMKDDGFTGSFCRSGSRPPSPRHALQTSPHPA